MHRVRIAIVMTALAVALLAPGAVGARSEASAARAEHDRIVAYWTPARMAAAKPKDYAYDPKLGKITPYAKPGGGGNVTGASWTGNGAIELRSGKLFFSTSAGNWQCSASVVSDGSTSNGYSVILTAGHCTYDGSEGWSFNVAYIPDYDDAPTSSCQNTVYGCWTSTRLAVHNDFHPSGFGPDAALEADYGFMRLGLGGKSGNTELDSITAAGGVTGVGYTLRINVSGNGDTQWAFGYPAQGRYKGRDLTYCKGSTIQDPYDLSTWGMACNMTGGSSGGPWLIGTTNPADGSGQLSSVNSYGYSGLSYMFGPRFDADTTTIFGDVQDGSASSVTVLH